MNGTRVVLILVIIILFILGFLMFPKKNASSPQPQNPDTITYIALGDSYTIGLDVTEEESWPSLLTNHLHDNGVQIELISNLAVTGYTANDVITSELPEFKTLKPEFATLLIGANDTSLEIDVNTYRKNLQTILDTMVSVLPDKNNLVVLTIPDYTNTPRGKIDFSSEAYKNRIIEYNEILKEETSKRNLSLVDLYDINEGISDDASYYTLDGLHPSAKQYQMWEKRIYPVAKRVLEKS